MNIKMTTHIDSGEYTYLLAVNEVNMLRVLSNLEKSPLVRSCPEQEGPNYFFYMQNCANQNPLIVYRPPERRRLDDSLKTALRVLDILPVDITAPLGFLKEDLITSKEELQTLERLVEFFREQKAPFLMIDESNCAVVGGYQPEGEVLYKGTESNPGLQDLFK